ncbi:MAG: LicD family protein [Bacteroidales bacterium]|nr:LicD family protein [Bacteroidales bacterium]
METTNKSKNKKEVCLEESKIICFKILLFFDSFCREHAIKYSLGEGTLLGAVRHKGFIPWDDDIDVLMERDQVDKFVSLYKQGPYKLFIPGKHDNWWSGVVRLTDTKTKVVFENSHEGPHGIWIALTPIDNAPDSERELQKLFNRRRVLASLCKLKVGARKYTHTPRGFIYRMINLIVPIKMLNKLYVNNLSHFNSKETKRKLKIRLHGNPLIFPSDIISGYTELEFEGQKFMAISHYDEYLKIMYGDYMTPPPESERVPKHNFKAYYLE